jgi:diguanylate cyclase (GGDEF)-like protein
MPFEMVKLDGLFKELKQNITLEESLSKIVRDIETEFDFQSLGIFLEVPNSDTFRLKISRNISHTFSKHEVLTSDHELLIELQKLQNLVLTTNSQFKFEHNYSHLLIMPLYYDEKLLGFMFIDRDKDEYNENEISKFCIFSSIVSIIVHSYKLEFRLEQISHWSDSGEIFDHASFIKRAELILDLMKRHSREICVCVLKINDFTSIIRTIGTDNGRKLIKDIQFLMNSNLRITDIIGKISDDTYALLLPETSEESSTYAISRFNKDIMNLPMMKNFKIGWGITGLSDENQTIEQMLRLSEESAFESTRKENGSFTFSLIDYILNIK